MNDAGHCSCEESTLDSVITESSMKSWSPARATVPGAHSWPYNTPLGVINQGALSSQKSFAMTVIRLLS